MSETYSEMMRRELGADVTKKPATRQEMYVLTDQILEKFAHIEDRLAEIEKSGARFRGVYQRAAPYRRGTLVTHRGSLWAALMEVPEGTAPGESPAHWQLAAKGTG